jgi:acyl carrier protein
VGDTGELYLGGEGLARGYLNAGMTADRFVPDPFSSTPGARLYRTGDLVRRRDDGQLEFIARLDAQVKIRGMRIEPGEIAAAIDRLAGIRESVIKVVEAEGTKQLAAYFVSSQDVSPDPETVRLALREHLPEAMVPAYLVSLDELPRTLNGKVDLAALPMPERQEGPGRVAPESLTETILQEIWAEVLGHVPAVEEDFFRIGGHSILAAQVTARIRERFEISFPFRAIMEAPTIARLAERIEEAIMADIDGEAVQ